MPARAAMAAAETADFHWHLARADRERRLQGGGAPRHWRWRVRPARESFKPCISALNRVLYFFSGLTRAASEVSCLQNSAGIHGGLLCTVHTVDGVLLVLGESSEG